MIMKEKHSTDNKITTDKVKLTVSNDSGTKNHLRPWKVTWSYKVKNLDRLSLILVLTHCLTVLDKKT